MAYAGLRVKSAHVAMYPLVTSPYNYSYDVIV